jgi:hypothetical protein
VPNGPEELREEEVVLLLDEGDTLGLERGFSLLAR